MKETVHGARLTATSWGTVLAGRTVAATPCDQTVPPMDEPVEHVDEHGNTLEIVERTIAREGRLRHRIVLAVVTNHDGRILCHQRAHTKPLMAGVRDITVGGAVEPGETPHVAATHELGEEFGIDRVTVAQVGEGPNDDEAGSVYAHLYVADWDGPVTPDPSEVADVAWLTVDEIGDLADRGDLWRGPAQMVAAHIDRLDRVLR